MCFSHLNLCLEKIVELESRNKMLIDKNMELERQVKSLLEIITDAYVFANDAYNLSNNVEARQQLAHICTILQRVMEEV